ncbi:hypothetical protein B0T17DRAFT_188990 [Bombardia bombarda]|uniref:Uncharacterized protein n=1 Tax=Bombardia bombarda TaxID=252184 RepID=A0AA40C9T6_9PEZI|nr:hypothetical protein B0T17DRAFT_188990 [Bombardia bombarda]
MSPTTVEDDNDTPSQEPVVTNVDGLDCSVPSETATTLGTDPVNTPTSSVNGDVSVSPEELPTLTVPHAMESTDGGCEDKKCEAVLDSIATSGNDAQVSSLASHKPPTDVILASCGDKPPASSESLDGESTGDQVSSEEKLNVPSNEATKVDKDVSLSPLGQDAAGTATSTTCLEGASGDKSTLSTETGPDNAVVNDTTEETTVDGDTEVNEKPEVVSSVESTEQTTEEAESGQESDSKEATEEAGKEGEKPTEEEGSPEAEAEAETEPEEEAEPVIPAKPPKYNPFDIPEEDDSEEKTDDNDSEENTPKPAVPSRPELRKLLKRLLPKLKEEVVHGPKSESPAEKEWLRQKTELGEKNEALDILMDMVGLENVKAEFLKVKATIEAARERKGQLRRQDLNLVLMGNAGTGKIFPFPLTCREVLTFISQPPRQENNSDALLPFS